MATPVIGILLVDLLKGFEEAWQSKEKKKVEGVLFGICRISNCTWWVSLIIGERDA